MNNKVIVLISVWFTAVGLHAQQELLQNPSFEGEPLMGGGGFSVGDLVDDWMDWNQFLFPQQSPPDVHAARSGYWGVITVPQDGQTFIGLVVRDSRTWEGIGQKLREPLQPGHRYLLSVYVCRDLRYESPSADDINTKKSFAAAAVLRISASAYRGRKEVFLWQSDPVQNDQWERLEVMLEPDQAFKYLVLSAYYDPARGSYYNGNLMLDHASLVEITPNDE